MKVGIDIDDVLANFVAKHKTLAFLRYGKPNMDVLPVDWAMSNYGLTPEEHAQIWQDISKAPNFWLKLKPVEGLDLPLLQELDKKHDLFFITARAPNLGPLHVSQQSVVWLKDYIGFLAPTVIVTHNKGPVAAAIGLDYYIDDRDKNCIEIKNAVPSCKVFLKNASHNQEFNHPSIPRLQSVNDFAQIILQVNN